MAMQYTTHLTMKKWLMLLLLVPTHLIFGQEEQEQNSHDFLPKGYMMYKQIQGDINGDGISDHVIIVKGTDKENIVINRFDKEVDRNRRGILIYLSEIDKNNLVLENLQCFMSENEDGGVYYAPELSIEIKEGKLNIEYKHGRYGSWSYIFQFQNSNFELVEYNEVYRNHGILEEVSFDEVKIDFLRKELSIFELAEIGNTGRIFAEDEEIIENKETVKVEEDSDGSQITYKTIFKKISIGVDKMIKLSEIICFKELDIADHITY